MSDGDANRGHPEEGGSLEKKQVNPQGTERKRRPCPFKRGNHMLQLTCNSRETSVNYKLALT